MHKHLTHSRVNKKLGEAGIVSIIVAIVMMGIITLIVLGFAQVSRRNAREALDRQLSSQAFYAAESGVNDYSKVIKSYLAKESNPDPSKLNQTTCKPESGSGTIYTTATYSPPDNGDGKLDSAGDVGYTCVLVNANPTSLQYSGVGSSAQVIPINSDNVVNNLTVSWQTTNTDPDNDVSADNCPSGVGNFPTSDDWPDGCGLGVLRVELVPVGGSVDFQSLQADTMTALFSPTKTNTGSGTVSYKGNGNNQYGGDANQGAVVAAKCSGQGSATGCSVTITDLSSKNYYLRVSSIYQTASLQVQGYTGSGPIDTSNPVELTKAQVLIDSTGKAQDVLRRIQVRLSVNQSSGSSGTSVFNDALQSAQSLCKQFTTYPGTSTPATGCTLP